MGHDRRDNDPSLLRHILDYKQYMQHRGVVGMILPRTSAPRGERVENTCIGGIAPEKWPDLYGLQGQGSVYVVDLGFVCFERGRHVKKH